MSELLKMSSGKEKVSILLRSGVEDAHKSLNESPLKEIKFHRRESSPVTEFDMREEILPGVKKRYDVIDNEKGRLCGIRISMSKQDSHALGSIVFEEVNRIRIDIATFPLATYDYNSVKGFMYIEIACGSSDYVQLKTIKIGLEKIGIEVEKGLKGRHFPGSLILNNKEEVLPGIPKRWIETSKTDESVLLGIRIAKSKANTRQVNNSIEREICEERELHQDALELHFYTNNQTPFFEVYARGIKDGNTAIEVMERIEGIVKRVEEHILPNVSKAS
jgi:hypothetical protein